MINGMMDNPNGQPSSQTPRRAPLSVLYYPYAITTILYYPYVTTTIYFNFRLYGGDGGIASAPQATEESDSYQRTLCGKCF